MSADRRVALLRGINVGKAKRVAMADLRALVEELGYRDVKTLLNSGNVVFTVPPGRRGDPAARLEKGLVERTGVSARILVLTAANLVRVIDENPLTGVATNPSRLSVHLLWDPADARRLASLAEQDWGGEAFAVGSRAAYVWCPDGYLESPLITALGKELGDRTTARNWSTIQKLKALL
jgi:uncharacterized protein (DUF1697 family)